MSRIRVLIEQNVIPHYRVPFFTELAKQVDLIVLASEHGQVDGLRDTTEALPFRTVRVAESATGPLQHPELLHILDAENIEVLVSWTSSFLRMLHDPSTFIRVKGTHRTLISFGCDGYHIRSFFKKLLQDFSPRHFFRSAKSRILLRKIDHFIAYSTHTKDFWRVVYRIPPKRISVGQNAIDTAELQTLYTTWQTRTPKTPNRSLIFTGRITPGKRVDVLIQAFAQVTHRYPDATLTLVGDGSERENMEKLTALLGIAEKVRFVGAIYQDTDLAPYLYQASLFIMPGLGGLGFNTAMAMGLPIIFTHADGTERDLIKEGEQGWFFDGTEKDLVRVLEEALTNPQRLLQMGQSAHERIATKYNLAHMVESYVEAITQAYHKTHSL